MQGAQKTKGEESGKKLHQTTTNRTNKSKKEIRLFRKKEKIENEIDEVNKQISELTTKYQNKMKKLKWIREELSNLD